MKTTQETLQRSIGAPVHTGPDAVTRANAALWNGAARHKRPIALVECSAPEQVQQAVRVAVDLGLPVSVLGGGHDWAGRAVCDDALVLDLRPMSLVEANLTQQLVKVHGGAKTKDVFEQLPDDVVAVTGTASSVGVVGLTIGGGYSRLTNHFGLALDTVQSADVVLANGEIVTASNTSEPDLFWAIRGGGGNYGVVTSLTLETYHLPSVLLALICFPLGSARTTLLNIQSLSETAPDELGLFFFLATGPEGQQGLFISPTWSGAAVQGEKFFDEICRWDGAQVIQRGWRPYKATFDENAEKAYPAGNGYCIDARNLASIDEATAEMLVEGARTFTSPGSFIIGHDFRGLPTRVPERATAFPLRQSHINLELVAGWPQGSLNAERPHIEWLRDLSNNLAKVALPGGYVNVLSAEDRERTRDFYGAAGSRLDQLKKRFDPDNLFRSNVGQLTAELDSVGSRP